MGHRIPKIPPKPMRNTNKEDKQEDRQKFQKLQRRAWVFTLNNPKEDEEIPFDEERMICLVYQLEKGTKRQIRHFQGYVLFKRSVRFGSVKKLVPKAHWEPRFGSHQDAINYCIKEKTRVAGTVPRVLGDVNHEQSELAEVIKEITEGSSMMDIAVEHEGFYLRNTYAISSIYNDAKRKKTQEITPFQTTYYFFSGESGTGKTTLVNKLFPYKSIYYKMGGKFWQGYEGEEVIVFDEVDKKDLGISTILEASDKKGITLETKFGSTSYNSNIMVLISNLSLDDLIRLKKPLDPIRRRLNYHYHFTKKGIKVAYELIKENPDKPIDNIISKHLEELYTHEMAKNLKSMERENPNLGITRTATTTKENIVKKIDEMIDAEEIPEEEKKIKKESMYRRLSEEMKKPEHINSIITINVQKDGNLNLYVKNKEL